MNRTIEFTQEELIALEELVKDTARESESPVWGEIWGKIYKATYNI